MQKTKKYEFYNIPREYSSGDYKEVVDYIIKKYSKINGLISIYDWGSLSDPGISDLDFIFVFDKNNAKSMPILSRAFYLLNDRFRYIARHPFFYIDEESFKNIKYVYPDAKFKLLFGRNIKINKISSIDNYFSKIALISDIIVRHYPRDFLEQIIIKSINARDMLLRLNSLKLSIKTIEILTKENHSDWDYKINQIEKLRKNWFKENDFESLELLNEDAVKIAMHITDKFRQFLIKNNIVKIESGDNVRYNGARNNALFIKNWGKEKALNDMSELIRNKKTFFSILPIELAPQQIEYSKYNGIISTYVNSKLNQALKYKLKYSDIIKKRALIFNSQAKLASQLRHSDFVAFFDFGYRNKSGINNTALNLIRIYRN